MRNLVLALAAALALSVPSAGIAQTDTADAIGDRSDVVETSPDDQEMNAAYAKAQETLPEFMAVLADPPPGTGSLAIKFPLAGWEHIWVSNVSYSNGVFTGTLDNVPLQEEWSLGDRVEVPMEDVSDWGYFGTDETMHGHFTTRVLLTRIDPQTAADIRREFGWD